MSIKLGHLSDRLEDLAQQAWLLQTGAAGLCVRYCNLAATLKGSENVNASATISVAHSMDDFGSSVSHLVACLLCMCTGLGIGQHLH